MKNKTVKGTQNGEDLRMQCDILESETEHWQLHKRSSLETLP